MFKNINITFLKVEIFMKNYQIENTIQINKNIQTLTNFVFFQNEICKFMLFKSNIENKTTFKMLKLFNIEEEILKIYPKLNYNDNSFKIFILESIDGLLFFKFENANENILKEMLKEAIKQKKFQKCVNLILNIVFKMSGYWTEIPFLLIKQYLEQALNEINIDNNVKITFIYQIIINFFSNGLYELCSFIVLKIFLPILKALYDNICSDDEIYKFILIFTLKNYGKSFFINFLYVLCYLCNNIDVYFCLIHESFELCVKDNKKEVLKYENKIQKRKRKKSLIVEEINLNKSEYINDLRKKKFGLINNDFENMDPILKIQLDRQVNY